MYSLIKNYLDFYIILDYSIRIILILVLGYILLILSKKAIKKLVRSNNKILDERKRETYYGIIVSITKYTIYFLMLMGILDVFNVSNSVLALAGLSSVAIGFGSQSLVKDFITGAFIIAEDQFGVGDIVTIEGLSGTVERVSFRTTSIRSADGSLHIFPNGEIKIVTNMSKSFKRATVDIPVSYQENIEKILKILNEEMQSFSSSNDEILSPPNVLGITSFNENNLNIRIMVDCKIGSNWSVERQIRHAVVIRFEKDKIKMPLQKGEVHFIN